MRARTARILTFVGLAFLLASCNEHRHEGESHHKDDGRDPTESTPSHEARSHGGHTYAVPVQSCTCSLGRQGIELHAPRAGKVLWWLGLTPGDISDEKAVHSGHGQSVIPPRSDARMLMACDGSLRDGTAIVAFVRRDRAAAWSYGHGGSAKVVWSAKLPSPLDDSTIDARSIAGTSARVGCRVASTTDGAFDVRLQNGSVLSVGVRTGKWK